MAGETLEDRVLKRIARKRADVFLRGDFADLGGYDQIGRTLRALVRKGRLLKIGYGLYTRAAPSILDGRPAPVKGFRKLTAEALARLGVKVLPSRIERAYAAGRTNQVPSGRTLAVDKRVRRKIGYNGVVAKLERVGSVAR